MLPNNYTELTFISHPGNEVFARNAIGCFVSPLALPPEALADIRTAVSEAVSNCIVHAYPKDIGLITLQCLVVDKGEVTIVVKDDGTGIEDMQTKRGSRGFAAIERTMTDVCITTKPGKGTAVYMTKKAKQGGR